MLSIKKKQQKAGFNLLYINILSLNSGRRFFLILQKYYIGMDKKWSFAILSRIGTTFNLNSLKLHTLKLKISIFRLFSRCLRVISIEELKIEHNKSRMSLNV